MQRSTSATGFALFLTFMVLLALIVEEVSASHHLHHKKKIKKLAKLGILAKILTPKLLPIPLPIPIPIKIIKNQHGGHGVRCYLCRFRAIPAALLTCCWVELPATEGVLVGVGDRD
ncbi:hypothetical protein MRX96_015459 [Rhipicephalus microplus]